LPDYDGYYSTAAADISKELRMLLTYCISLIRISAETIYGFIYGKEDYGLALYRYLPEARRKRRPRGLRKPRNGAFAASHKISQRPDYTGDRTQFGHGEGDLLIFERELARHFPCRTQKLLHRDDQEPKPALVTNHGHDHQAILALTVLCPPKLHT